MTRRPVPDPAFLEHASIIQQLGRELLESIHVGAALAMVTLAAGCGAKASTEGDANLPAGNAGGMGSGGSSSLEASSGRDAGAVDPGMPARDLVTYSADDIGCFGPATNSPLYGPQCCFDARCYEPEPGADCVTDLGSEPLRSLLPPGSGSCGCQVQEEGRPFVAGPYAPNPELQPTSPPGENRVCCYVVGSLGCTGRPFVVRGAPRIADVAERGDWGLFV